MGLLEKKKKGNSLNESQNNHGQLLNEISTCCERLYLTLLFAMKQYEKLLWFVKVNSLWEREKNTYKIKMTIQGLNMIYHLKGWKYL